MPTIDKLETWGEYAAVEYFQIGSISVRRTAVLAPMAGVGDMAFRELCRAYGAAYSTGEMVSSKGLCYQDKKTNQLLPLGAGERPGAVQIFGDEPLAMARAAELTLAYHPDSIDINMGCPAPKIAGNGGGSALMKTPELAAQIIKAVVAAVDVPVTVKFRKGWDELSVNAVAFAKMAEQSGAAAITVHGRTRKQMYAPPVDLDIIRAVKEAVRVPVIGNGDVTDVKSCLEMYERTGCDGVMIGRGALGAPWVFGQIERYFQDGVLLPEPPVEERMAVMLRQFKAACGYKGEGQAMREARKHAGWYLKGARGAAGFRRLAGQMKTYTDAEILAEEVLRRQHQEE